MTTLPRVHARLSWKDHELGIRDLTGSDLREVVAYWTNAQPEFLEQLGVDSSRLGSSGQIRDRFEAALPTGDPSQLQQAFAIEFDQRLIGYTLLNCDLTKNGISHWHLIDPKARGKGVTTILYPWRLQTYFKNSEIERLTHQTRVSNRAMNAVLDKFLPLAQTCYLAKPDGVALPGKFNIRVVGRKQAEEIVAAATPQSN